MTLAERLAEPDVATLPDWQAAEVLNAPDPVLPTKRVNVPTSDARALLLATGEWGAIKILSRSAPSETVPVQAIAAAITAIDTLELTTTLEVANPAYWAAMQAMVGGLQAAGVLSAETGTALLALADQTQSWAEANGIAVDARAVGLARGAI